MRWFWWSFIIGGLLIPAGLGFAIFAQRHWARVALAAYFIIEWLVLGISAVLARETVVLLDVELLAYFGAQVAIVALLFAAPSSKWFRARNL